eukprot:3321102-Amphidinium_carterae.1
MIRNGLPQRALTSWRIGIPPLPMTCCSKFMAHPHSILRLTRVPFSNHDLALCTASTDLSASEVSS